MCLGYSANCDRTEERSDLNEEVPLVRKVRCLVKLSFGCCGSTMSSQLFLSDALRCWRESIYFVFAFHPTDLS